MCYKHSTLEPENNEPICPVSFEMTRILVGGDPAGRKGFWKKYRENLVHNQRTKYLNTRVQLCARHLEKLKLDPDDTHYFRDGNLVVFRGVKPA
jgi:hypothetical protein